jgi:hypothetical protein
MVHKAETFPPVTLAHSRPWLPRSALWLRPMPAHRRIIRLIAVALATRPTGWRRRSAGLPHVNRRHV